MPHDEERLPPEREKDGRAKRGRVKDPPPPPPAEQMPAVHGPLTTPGPPPPPAHPGREGGSTKLTDTNIPTLMDAAFQLNTSIQNLWNTFVAFSGVVVGLLMTAQKLTLWPRLLAGVIYLTFVAVNFSALNKKYSWLGDVLVSLRMAARGIAGDELERFKMAARRTRIPGEWASKLSHGEWKSTLRGDESETQSPPYKRNSRWHKLGTKKIFGIRLGSHGLGFYAYLVIVVAVLAVFVISA